MAQYKVPQDVEAEDKLLGPFTFRQFIYLLIAAAGIAGAWGLFQLFPLLALIPLPFVIFFGILALPIKKDQPMETYIAAIVSFYLKPNRRIWTAGQRESTIKIIAPKKVEKSRVRNITEDEASHRLSFLASIVDTEGYAIRGDSVMKEEYAAEANTIEDVLAADNPVIDRIIEQEQTTRKQELVSQMRTALNRTEALSAPAQPLQPAQQAAMVNQQFQNLANNTSFSVQTIAQQANRIQRSVPAPAPAPMPAPTPAVTPVPPVSMSMPLPAAPATATAPQFTPMSVPLPHETGPGHMYQPIQTPEEPKTPDRPDLYGPPTAIFSS